MGPRLWWCGGLALVLGAGACATALLPTEQDGSAPDGSAPDGSTSDAACACEAGGVCSNGQCKAACDSPTTKCASDAGSVCANLTSDPNHCGQCTTACAAADAGALLPGPNNPNNPGISYDGGIGWTIGTPACDASTCTADCPQGMTTCSDGICYDTQNFHDHCGSCATACTAQQWCNHGNCCALGQEYCNGSCIDVLGDKNNCGACGNVCSGGTPNCSAGVCTAGCTPSGTRQAFNTLSSKTATGCFTTSPCATGSYSWSSNNIQAFENLNENMVCSGTTACVGHVGINTWASSTTICHGSWDVYCDTTKVGTIVATGNACGGDPMTNGCSTSFTPMTCSSIKFVLSAGTGVQCCLTTGNGPDTAISGVSAW